MPFFSQKKPKKFNYKPIYFQEEENSTNRNGFSEKMTNLWNRDSYQDQKKLGTKRIYRLILFVAILILGIIKFLDYVNQI